MLKNNDASSYSFTGITGLGIILIGLAKCGRFLFHDEILNGFITLGLLICFILALGYILVCFNDPEFFLKLEDPFIFTRNGKASYGGEKASVIAKILSALYLGSVAIGLLIFFSCPLQIILNENIAGLDDWFASASSYLSFLMVLVAWMTLKSVAENLVAARRDENTERFFKICREMLHQLSHEFKDGSNYLKDFKLTLLNNVDTNELYLEDAKLLDLLAEYIVMLKKDNDNQPMGRWIYD